METHFTPHGHFKPEPPVVQPQIPKIDVAPAPSEPKTKQRAKNATTSKPQTTTTNAAKTGAAETTARSHSPAHVTEEGLGLLGLSRSISAASNDITSTDLLDAPSDDEEALTPVKVGNESIKSAKTPKSNKPCGHTCGDKRLCRHRAFLHFLLFNPFSI